MSENYVNFYKNGPRKNANRKKFNIISDLFFI